MIPYNDATHFDGVYLGYGSRESDLEEHLIPLHEREPHMQIMAKDNETPEPPLTEEQWQVHLAKEAQD